MIRITILLASLCAGSLAVLAGCSEPDAASQVAEAIAAMQQGIEEKQRNQVTERLARDFQAQGSRGRADMQSMMLYYFRQHQHISIIINDQQIRVTGEQADVTLDALLLGGGSLLPERGARYDVAMRWQKIDDQWKLSRLKWQRANRRD